MKRCNYTDYASVRASELPDNVPKRQGPRGGVKILFTTKLHTLLEENLDEDIISWQPHGRSFLVHRPTDFLNDVMPKYFLQSKLASFLRQLNLYGFTRMMSPGPDKGSYYHALFLRGKSELLPHVIRTRIKGLDAKILVGALAEPRFFYLPFLPTSKMSSSTKKGSQKDNEPQKGDSSLKRYAHSAPVRNDSWSDLKVSPRRLQHSRAYCHLPESPSDVTAYRFDNHTEETEIQSYFTKPPSYPGMTQEGYDRTERMSRLLPSFQEPSIKQAKFRPDGYHPKMRLHHQTTFRPDGCRPRIRLSRRRNYKRKNLHSTEEALLLEAQEELTANPSYLDFDFDPSTIFDQAQEELPNPSFLDLDYDPSTFFD